jgi:4a-hydroxytetrahydrobiopterin dehydratase
MDKDLMPLNEREVLERIINLRGWTYSDNKIFKEFKFGSFSAVVDFIRKLAVFCNKIDHHPDIHIYYTKVIFEIQSVGVGGKVTDRDFTVAEEIERLYSQT